MTKEEKIICKEFLNDADNTHSCNEYKLLMQLLEQQPCEDVVSREAVHDGMIKYGFHASDMTITEFVEDVLPPVTPTSKKGKWIIDDEELGIIWHCHCSKCKKAPQDYIGGTENWWLVRLPDYCPNCGIEMESEEE